MALFGKKKAETPGLVGVDIGAGGIKAVELIPEKNRVRLATYGFSELKKYEDKAPTLLDSPKQAAEILTRILKEAGIKSRRANASLPSQSIFHAIITIPRPKSAKEDIRPAIEAQVKKLAPLPIEEMILDTTVIDKDLLPKLESSEKSEQEKESDSGKHIRVLVSGAPKDLVAKYVEIFKLAKLELISLETEAFALIRSLVGKDKARILIVDIGYRRTNITIVNNGIPFLHRSIQAGGENVTKMMAQQMGVSHSEAEQSKRDLSMAESDTVLPPVLKEAMMPIMHEVKYALELYAAQDFHDHSSVEKIIITGGSAQLPQIDTFLSETLNLNVYIGDPWARVATPAALRPVLDEIGSRFSVAIGLAMKDLEKK
ncbi:MAG: type IV pilus assembly protein PilM [Patescibacteria group bacterium]|nr:type IV pilus assembly protein PilM [Patescibacteria group bacterium]